MTADLADDPDRSNPLCDDAPCLNPADRLPGFSAIIEEIVSPPMRKVPLQRLQRLFVEGDFLILSRFLFDEDDMLPEFFTVKIVDIFPPKPEQIANAERSASAENDKNVISEFSLHQKEVGQSLELFFVADRFSCCHNIVNPFVSQIWLAEG